jgi:putative transposase
LVADLLDVVLEAEGRCHPRQVDNAHIESFNGRLRDGCLNFRWFESIDDARQTLQAWRCDFNEVRPHSSLGELPPAALAAQIQGVAPELCSQG